MSDLRCEVCQKELSELGEPRGMVGGGSPAGFAICVECLAFVKALKEEANLRPFPYGDRELNSLPVLRFLQKYCQRDGMLLDQIRVKDFLNVFEFEARRRFQLVEHSVRRPAARNIPGAQSGVGSAAERLVQALADALLTQGSAKSPAVLSDRDTSGMLAMLTKLYGVAGIDLDEFEITEDVLHLVPRDVCDRHGVIPINRAGSTLIVAMADPSDIFAIDDLKFLTGYNIEVVVSSAAQIRAAIEKYYGQRVERSAEAIVRESMPDAVRLRDWFRKVATPPANEQGRETQKLGIPPLRVADIAGIGRQVNLDSFDTLFHDLSLQAIPEDMLRLLPRDVCEQHHVIPIGLSATEKGTTLYVAISHEAFCSETFDSEELIRHLVVFVTGYQNIELVVVARVQLDAAIAKYYPKQAVPSEPPADAGEEAETPVDSAPSDEEKK